MDYSQAFILAFVQGVTEWLPVSSSGHLVILQHLMGLTVPVAFDVMLHLGTLFSVLLFMRKDVASIVQKCVELDFKAPEGRLALYVVVGTIPAGVAGLLFKSWFESLFSSLKAVGLGLFLTALLLFASRNAAGRKDVGLKTSIKIGLVQAVSIIPGVSRSGSTISAGLLLGLRRSEAAKFSFLLSIPAIAGATVVEYRHLDFSTLTPLLVASSVLVSFAVGYVSLGLLWKTVNEDKFHLFAYYCLLVGMALLLL